MTPVESPASFRLLGHVRRFRPHVIHVLFGPNLFAALAGRASGVPRWSWRSATSTRSIRHEQDAMQRIATGLHHVTAVSEAVADTVVAFGVPGPESA